MRRILVAFCLMAYIAVTIFVGNIIVKNQCNDFKQEIKDIRGYIINDELLSANKKIIDVKSLWHNKKAVISIFSNHSPLDEITVCIDKLSASTEIGDTPKALVICAEISAQIDRITEEQRIHVESFF